MSLRHSKEALQTVPDGETNPRVLILGGGISAAIAAQALKNTGLQVTFARIQDISENVYVPYPSRSDDFVKDLAALPGEIEIIDVTQIPVIERTESMFRAVFEDKTESTNDCIFLSPGVALKPVPERLPQGTELFTAQTGVLPSERVAFLLDYAELTAPAVGMSAIRVATDHVRNGGEALICFKHAPVLHVFGETLYQAARKAGVRFVRFGEKLPEIQVSGDKEGRKHFQVATEDVIDSGNEFVWESDRLIVATGPDASSIPGWAQKIIKGDFDGRGYMLSDSIDSSVGRSLQSGVFVVGGATGNLDYIGSTAQAYAAAAEAKAWIENSLLKRNKETLSIDTTCVRCLTCYRVCPHGALSLQVNTSRSRIQPLSSFCVECGICASVCPAAAITLTACPQESINAFINDVSPSDLPKTTFVFGCKRSAAMMAKSMEMPENARFLEVPCAGSVSEHSIWSALAAGAKGVLVVGCHDGNCHSHVGTNLAAARVEQARSIGIFDGNPKIGYFTVAPNEYARFQRLLSEFLQIED
ncbi:hydrogenase iron-sulfur subunit [Desulfomonile tiedjei]|uniref:Methyl-viologen-reducing hydrogenase, delta subunit n=1 Tax=Desulfomonile tiedjei (strain ATCC 49306 / DSM 6799 / DCB-1) TaxID=706587 RepID=I4C6I0_DESTA|nr:hydrogenase iron-sulfur subunit [Desulfomonile tiedjei]AFM25171.1 Methyl-viologen-reducing hydrogenase, delta subunit [Desulfomonile tiedjei DSM 6799]